MSIQATFEAYHTAAAGNSILDRRAQHDIETAIGENVRFREEMGADLLTYPPRQLSELMRGIPSAGRLLLNRCKNAQTTKTASLSAALDEYAEMIAEGKGGQYKIGKKQDGTFKMYKKGFTSDCSRVFNKTDFTGIRTDLQRHKELTSYEQGFSDGKLRQAALREVISYVSEKSFKARQ